MNAIIVGPYLLGLLIGYVALVIVTIRAVSRSISSRRRVQESAASAVRPPWLSAGSAILLTCTVLLTAGIASSILFTPQPADDVEASSLTGTWVSTSRKAPGSFEISEGGAITLNDLTFMTEQGVSLPPEFRTVSASGNWEQYGSQLGVRLRADGESLSWDLGIYRNLIGGLTLQAIAGDPDSPTFTQVFTKAHP